jgi:uncharacterized protein (TIGR02271 family)
MTHSTGQVDDGFEDRGRRGNDTESTPRIAALSDLDNFEVADGTPDPRGWTVKDSTGTDVGKVHDLIVDTVSMRTRYLDVKLDKKKLKLDDDRDILIPVGQAKLDDDDDRVILGGLSSAQVTALPAYTHGSIDRNYEDSLLGSLGSRANDAMVNGSSMATTSTTGDTAGSAQTTRNDAQSQDYYDSHHFDDSNFYGNRRPQQNDQDRLTRSEEELSIGKRRVPAGTVSIRKRVETQHVSQPVSTTHEEVTLERRPVTNADSAPRGELGDGEIRIPVYEDEIVVDKRRVLKEEIVVKKKDVQDTKNVEADLRKERIDVDDSAVRNQGSTDDRKQM